MTSQYDAYWQGLSTDLARMLNEASRVGRSGTLDVNAMRAFGSRRTWSGRVELRDEQITFDNAAHARALGNAICALGLARRYPGVPFSLTISNGGHLQVRSMRQGLQTAHADGVTVAQRETPSYETSNATRTKVRGKPIPFPTLQELNAAHAEFEQVEPRGLFYRAATELVTLALRGETSLSVPEALAVLLQTWNVSYYRFHGKFDESHFADLDSLIMHNCSKLAKYRDRAIDGLRSDEEQVVCDLFSSFETVLGPVGAAKCLHLLAPSFFPLWDRNITARYGVALGVTGTNASRYWAFAQIARKQSEKLGGIEGIGRNPLKALDEFNYVRFTLGSKAS